MKLVYRPEEVERRSWSDCGPAPDPDVGRVGVFPTLDGGVAPRALHQGSVSLLPLDGFTQETRVILRKRIMPGMIKRRNRESKTTLP